MGCVAHMDPRSTKQFQIQDAEYAFPYHHICHFDDRGTAVRFRVLTWA